jgi:hypothetical protein|tara:strand:- start:219 stop:533 length:315 start_codon:yes stop_codon:yes gene_type:complete
VAHAARIGSGGVVREVVVVDDDNFTDANGKTIKGKVGTFPQDQLLMDYMESLGLHDPASGEEWLFTSYNGNFRGSFAGQGFTYDRRLMEFKPPEPPETPTEEES